ncbi:galectin-8-like isoform X2 [Thalassophryne amazonica]|uniref:galectin-8-like isoform X2 n=1 Tax=Thalassophryne amazonica TaxID=390379 RepID=UPI0014713327|nr:galectin-8-like isoform X2 [Thalassophryne amazonica]
MSGLNPKQTFLNPVIPFTGTILGGLLPGEMVLIRGSVPSVAQRFQLDLQCSGSVKPRADIAFHFNPRLEKSPSIVCNTMQRERWGREEILYQMPFRHGEAFELIILVQRDKFKVAVNGAHLLEYRHRVQLELIDTLAIGGDIKVEAVAFFASTPGISFSGDLCIPFRGELKDGLTVGRLITVTARTNHDADCFCVNLCMSDSSDIALHLNPRLKKQLFVRNSFLSDCWGPEETQVDVFPFAAGEYFEIIILCHDHFFKVAVNGTHMLTYKYRVQDLKTITHLEVEGDIHQLNVKIQ